MGPNVHDVAGSWQKLLQKGHPVFLKDLFERIVPLGKSAQMVLFFDQLKTQTMALSKRKRSKER